MNPTGLEYLCVEEPFDLGVDLEHPFGLRADPEHLVSPLGYHVSHVVYLVYLDCVVAPLGYQTY